MQTGGVGVGTGRGVSGLDSVGTQTVGVGTGRLGGGTGSEMPPVVSCHRSMAAESEQPQAGLATSCLRLALRQRPLWPAISPHNLGSARVWRGNEDPPAIERVR